MWDYLPKFKRKPDRREKGCGGSPRKIQVEREPFICKGLKNKKQSMRLIQRAISNYFILGK